MDAQAQYADLLERRARALKLGLPRPVNPPTPLETIEEAARLWATGMTTREIGYILGRTRLSIKGMVRKPANRHLFPRRPQRVTTEAERQVIRRLYEGGVSTGTIGKYLGFSPTTVYAMLRRVIGVETRPAGPRCITKLIPPSEIARCRLAGMSIREIGCAMNQKRAFVATIAYRCGLTLEAIEAIRSLSPRALIEYRDALDDLQNHADALEVALEYVGSSTVRVKARMAAWPQD